MVAHVMYTETLYRRGIRVL